MSIEMEEFGGNEAEFLHGSKEYGADQIQILEGLEAVRKRPGMYIGSTSVRGLHHLVYEIVDNSVDEALAGFCNTITVKIHQDNSITVRESPPWKLFSPSFMQEESSEEPDTRFPAVFTV